ncbi:beta-N-acetylhexosaminidase [Snodgrassella alvi]|uniref:beta-N-acetylhexosaminidase n=1 Tax=Snodgrassella alvi TaxID=1196083 RepID=UPI002148128D|nr:beta-N-acetylhexosaminidase [Snodgrassella alvi]
MLSAPPKALARGPVMADVAAFQLSAAERERLSHPAIGGVILFRRNYQSRAQLTRLVAEIKALRTPELIVAVDHEGGRVQRFIPEFTRLPAMRTLGQCWEQHGAAMADKMAETVGWVLAIELRACGIDLSFTPVLDLDWGECPVIGNRSFHQQPAVVSALAIALQRGLARGGMACCGKHFPGHGAASGDSHLTMPEDNRSWEELWADDIQPFNDLIHHGMPALMPAHVVYPRIDPTEPAGFSTIWLEEILRDKMQFDGVIFSDDLTMEGASSAGNIQQRTAHAFAAGCDIALVCNRPDWVDNLLDGFVWPDTSRLAQRWQMIAGCGTAAQYCATMQTPEFQAAQQLVASLASAQDTFNGVQVGEAC